MVCVCYLHALYDALFDFELQWDGQMQRQKGENGEDAREDKRDLMML